MSDAAAKRRARQTLINLVLSLSATIGVMVLLVLAVPRDDSNRIQPVAYQEIAAEASNQAPDELLVPVFPVDWYSNAARYRSSAQDGVANWYVGFVGPKSEFVAMTQGFETNQTWIQFQLGPNKPTGEYISGDATWIIYENPKQTTPPKSKDYLMLYEYGSNAVFIYGVTPIEILQDFADQLTRQILENKSE